MGTVVSKVVGHSAQREALAKLAQRQRLPSALLFVGPAGVGKRLIALEVAKQIFCDDPTHPQAGCGKCKSCSIFEAGNNPDLHLLHCSAKEQSGTDSVRELLSALALKPYFGKARVVLLNDAEDLHLASANILLKSLEEPRPGTHFILISANPRKLPPTVASRCQSWFFPRLTEHEVNQYLVSRFGAEAVERKSIALLAEGSLEQIDTLCEASDDWSTLWNSLDRIAEGDTVRGAELAAQITKEKDKIGHTLRLLRSITRTKLIQSKEKARWALALQNVLYAERLINERNLAPGTVLALVMLSIAEAAPFTSWPNSDTLLSRIAL